MQPLFFPCRSNIANPLANWFPDVTRYPIIGYKYGMIARTSAPRSSTATALVAIMTVLLLSSILNSCSKTIGWGVVLWPPEGSALEFGAAVPVLFKSNITKTYALRLPDSKDVEELELWRIDLYQNRKGAEKAAAAYAELAPIFGITARDGLLLRDKPENLGTQVYRLRVDQEVKLLRKVHGSVVETGGVPLPGDWYQALAEDGTTGYVFSNQLIFWNGKEEVRPSASTNAPRLDIQIGELFNSVWRPDYFIPMADSGEVDLRSYHPRFGLFADATQRIVRVERPGFSKVYRYTSVTQASDGTFELVPSGAKIHFNQSGDLVLTPLESDLSAALQASRDPENPDVPITLIFRKQRDDPQTVILAEERRRIARLGSLVADGERFESEFFGVLIMTRSARFTWVGTEELVPFLIPEDAGETGAILMDTFLSPELALSWNGAFSLLFDSEKQPRVTFAYRATPDGLELAHLPPSLVAGATASSPTELGTIAYFARYR